MSKLFTLGWSDIGKGLVMYVLGAVLTALYEALNTGMAVNFHSMLIVGGLSALSYIIKNFFSTPDGKVLGKIG